MFQPYSSAEWPSMSIESSDAVAITSNIIYFSQCQAFTPWMLWLQNPSVKFSGDEPLLAIWRSCHLYIRSPKLSSFHARTSWNISALLCCPSSWCWGCWNCPWGPGPAKVRLFLSVCLQRVSPTLPVLLLILAHKLSISFSSIPRQHPMNSSCSLCKGQFFLLIFLPCLF